MRGAFRPFSARFDREAFDGGVEIHVRSAAAQKFDQMIAKWVGHWWSSTISVLF
jgi:hypothetical protein